MQDLTLHQPEASEMQLQPLAAFDYSLPQVWDSTMIVAYRKCARYFQNAHIHHLRGPGTALPLTFGGTFAKGLETYRQAYYAHSGNHHIAFEKAYVKMLHEWNGDNELVKDDKRTFARCVDALEQYFINWPIETDSLQPHISNGKPTFEYSFAIPLEREPFPRRPDGSPFILAGRMDTLGSFDSLPVWSDEKTTIVMGPKWAEQWTVRHQFLTYGWALRELGFKARHYIVRGICINLNETKFEQTPPYHVPDHLLNRFELALAMTLRKALHDSATSHFQPEYGEACYSHFRVCSYWHSCSAKPQNELAFLRVLPRHQWDPLRVVDTGGDL